MNESEIPFTHATFWRRALAYAMPDSGLIADGHAGVQPSKQSVRAPFSADATTRLDLAAGTSDLSVFVIAIACVRILIRRHILRDDITIGVPGLHARNLTLPLRMAVTDAMSFHGLLARTRRQLAEVYAHECMPDNMPSAEVDARVCMSGFHTNIAEDNKHLITINVLVERAPDNALKRAQYEFAYDANRFDTSIISAMTNQLAAITEQALAHPSLTIAELQSVSAAGDAERMLRLLSGPARAYPVDKPVHALFEMQADASPERIAVLDANERWSYRKLNQAANRVAHRLLAVGLERGDHVGVLAPRGCAFAAALTGILKAGGVYVPIDITYPSDRIRFMIEDSGMTALIATAAMAEAVHEAGAVRNLLILDNMSPSIPARPGLDVHALDGGRDLPDTNPGVTSGGTDAAYMLYTSGSTGQPKGAIVRHDGAVNHIFAQCEALGLDHDTAFLQSAPVSSDISVWQYLAPLAIGGRLVIASYETMCNPTTLRETIRREGVTLIELVPAVMRELLEDAERLTPAERDLPLLAAAMVTGEAVPPSLINQWFSIYPRIRLANAYGPTEAADDICQAVFNGPLPDARCRVTIGQPLANTFMYVLDKQHRPVPAGAPGELCVSGVCVGAGYWNRADLTQASFVANPYAGNGRGAVLYRTGDLGRWRPDGTLEFLGRMDTQEKIRGYRIETAEIEAVLMQHPAVKAAVVIVCDDLHGHRSLAAYVSLRTGAGQADLPTELRRCLQSWLPAHMVPTSIMILASLPLLPGGKINRKALPRPDQTASGTTQKRISPAGLLENRIADIWCDLLNLDAVGVNDNFFDVGGYSLLAARMHRRLTEVLGPDLTIVDLFQYPTIRSLAERYGTNSPAATGDPDRKRTATRDAAPSMAARQRAIRRQHREGTSI